MKLNKLKARAFMLAVCLTGISLLSYGQSKTGNIESRVFPAPVVTKGYYSIYNNAEKLNSHAGRLVFSNNFTPSFKPESNTSAATKKGYFSIGNNAGKNRTQMAKEGISFSNDTPARVIQNPTFPVIHKGYYSIGDNAKKLQK